MIEIKEKVAQEEPKKKPAKKHGCLWSIIVCVVLYGVLVGIVTASLGDSSVTLKDNSVYRLKLEGMLTEQAAEVNPFDALLNQMPYGNRTTTVGLDEILSNIRLAAEDEHIVGIYLEEGMLSCGPAQAKAIRDALLGFKESGKWVIAYAHRYDCYSYYIASVADKIYLNPTGEVTWHGAMAAKMYYKRLFEKIGVDMQILKVGTFKSAVEPYFRTSMSEADKAQTMRFISGIWDELVSAVGESRGLDSETLNRYADEVLELQDAATYIEKGIVDSLLYPQEMDSLMHRMLGGKPVMFSTRQMARVERNHAKSANKIAVVYADGDITDDNVQGIGGKQYVKTLGKVLNDEEVRAVVIRVNSPGGSADASEQIWHAEQLLKQKGLPVVVSMGTYAASGGYYMSCGADYIYAEPTTITGSIGIFGMIPSYKGLREKVGIDIDGIQTNAHSLMFTHMIYDGMNREEQALMQRMIERGYDLFTRRCAEGRHMSQDDIKAIAEGRVWLGRDALEIGLVDGLGNIDDAIAKAAELAELEDYETKAYPQKKDVLTQMLEELSGMSEEEKMLAKIREMVKAPRMMAQMEEVML